MDTSLQDWKLGIRDVHHQNITRHEFISCYCHATKMSRGKTEPDEIKNAL